MILRSNNEIFNRYNFKYSPFGLNFINMFHYLISILYEKEILIFPK